MSKILLAIALCCLVAMGIQPAHAAPSDDSTITSFTTSVTKIDRDELANRTARIPVSWTTENRLVYTNLIFEQILPNGDVINVELPRIIPWVASNGDGIAAPILTSEDEVLLTARLVNLLNGQTLDEREITLAVEDDGDNETSDAYRPAITSFTTCCPFAKRDQLADGSARIPVSWQAINRPVTSNLIFEQILSDGTVVNVELPREISWVASSGNGTAAPIEPGGEADTLALRVRLIDLLTGRVYDQRTLTVEIGVVAAQDPVISYFTTSAAKVSATSLADGTARIPVSWAVENRPAGTNLVFEQVMPDGEVINVELPRDVLIVPSAGNGTAAPELPDDDVTEIVLQVRLAELDNGATLTKKTIRLPIEGQIGQDDNDDTGISITECYTEPFPAGSGITVGNEVVVTETIPSGGLQMTTLSAPRGGPTGEILNSNAVVTIIAGPGCYRRDEPLATFRQWQVRTATGAVGWAHEYEQIDGSVNVFLLPHDDAPERTEEPAAPAVVELSANPSALNPGSAFTVSWTTANASRVTLDYYGAGSEGIIGQNPLEQYTDLPLNGSQTLNVPLGYAKDGVTVIVTAIGADDLSAADALVLRVEIPPTGGNDPQRFGVLTISPAVSDDGGWLVVQPNQPLTVALTGGNLAGVTQVDFYLTPTGTGTADAATLIGSDTNMSDSVAISWTPVGAFGGHVTATVTLADGSRIEAGVVNVYAEEGA
jgi:hypothetical protein